MKKKLLIIMLVLGIMISTLTSTYAVEGFFNFGMFETAYKLSKSTDIDLPFINMFLKSAVYDKDVKHSGISYGDSTIDVNEKLEGVHLILATDMITIKGEVEHGIIYGNNIVVEGKISDDTILMANTIKILDTAVIGRDVVVVANNLEMAGSVNGHLIGSADDAKITGKVAGDLRLDVAQATFDGTVDGDIYITVPEGNASKLAAIKEKYPNAVIKENVKVDGAKSGEEIANIVYQGIIAIIIYTVVALLVTKKDNNIVLVATDRFKEHTIFGIAMSTLMWLAAIVAPILLFMVGILGLGVVAWPLLVIYIGLLLLTLSISSFVVGATIYQAVKNKVGKFKIPVAIVIFAVIYALSQITAISMYVWIAKNLVTLAIIMTYMFKKEGYGREV